MTLLLSQQPAIGSRCSPLFSPFRYPESCALWPRVQPQPHRQGCCGLWRSQLQRRRREAAARPARASYLAGDGRVTRSLFVGVAPPESFIVGSLALVRLCLKRFILCTRVALSHTSFYSFPIILVFVSFRFTLAVSERDVSYVGYTPRAYYRSFL